MRSITNKMRYKTDLINWLGRQWGYSSFLEISSLISGNLYTLIDPRVYVKRDCLAYRIPLLDQMMPDKKMEHSVPLLPYHQHVERLRALGYKFDMILVDSFHTFEQSYLDIEMALSFLAPGGTIMVHDCLPEDLHCTGNDVELVNGCWCGQTYEAFIKFRLKHPEMEINTVHIDMGCGLIRPHVRGSLLDQDGGKVGKFWDLDFERVGSDVAYLYENQDDFLGLMSVPSFLEHYRNPAKGENLVAVMVEPRVHEGIKVAVESMLRELPVETRIYIYHVVENKDYLTGLFCHEFNYGRVHLIEMDSGEGFDRNAYNKMLLSPGFWEELPCENILIFQADSCLLRPLDLWKWQDYAYVGAPWGAPPFSGGNGGLSFRKKSWMLKCLSHLESQPEMVEKWEDRVFVRTLQELGAPLAPIELAKRFSVEEIFYPAPIGIHKPWCYFQDERLDLLRLNPTAKSLIDLYHYTPKVPVVESNKDVTKKKPKKDKGKRRDKKKSAK